ncbi:hypothetical protein Adt_03520 [Abeliophyllum distichum]|uniref:Uncharacterized protein n=1 Tax=Abeliophyllum distichum TaxID=126358 RepID=A0ABD1VZ05_9LAMI
MDSENTKLGSKNEPLCSKVEALVLVKADLEAKLESVFEDRQRDKQRALVAKSLKMIAGGAWRWANKRVAVVEKTITLVNCDFNTRVLMKDRQLAKAMAELSNLKEQLARSEVPSCADPKEAIGP